MEERVAREGVRMILQPSVEIDLLVRRRMELVPRVRAPTRRTQPREPQLCTVPIRERLKRVELRHVVPRDDDADLERTESCRREMVHRPSRRRVRPRASHRVVGRRGRAVDGDLHVHVVRAGQPRHALRRDRRPVGGELHTDAVADRVVDECVEVGADRRFTAADVHVEDLHGAQLVDDGHGFRGRQLVRIASARRGQAMDASEIASVGELPGEADGRLEPVLQLFDERAPVTRHTGG